MGQVITRSSATPHLHSSHVPAVITRSSATPHLQLPMAWTEHGMVPQRGFFFQNHPATFFLQPVGPLREGSPLGYATCCQSALPSPEMRANPSNCGVLKLDSTQKTETELTFWYVFLYVVHSEPFQSKPSKISTRRLKSPVGLLWVLWLPCAVGLPIVTDATWLKNPKSWVQIDQPRKKESKTKPIFRAFETVQCPSMQSGAFCRTKLAELSPAKCPTKSHAKKFRSDFHIPPSWLPHYDWHIMVWFRCP